MFGSHGRGPSMPELFQAAPASTSTAEVRRRILTFGDSLTAGWFNRGREFEPYGKTMRTLLAPRVAADIWVCGLSGYGAGQMVDSLNKTNLQDSTGRRGKGLRLALSEHGPMDIVIIMAGTNDCGRHLPPDEVVAAVRRLHETCHSAGVKTVMLSVPPSRQMCTAPTARDRRQAVNNELLAWASEKPPGLALFIDVETIVPWSEGSPLWEPDGLHFSKLGSKHLGANLATRLLPLLSSDIAAWVAPIPSMIAPRNGGMQQRLDSEADFELGCHVGFPVILEEETKGLQGGGPVPAEDIDEMDLPFGCHVGGPSILDASKLRRHHSARQSESGGRGDINVVDIDEDEFPIGCHVGMPMLADEGIPEGLAALQASSDARLEQVPAEVHRAPRAASKLTPGRVFHPPHLQDATNFGESDPDEGWRLDSDEDMPTITCHSSSRVPAAKVSTGSRTPVAPAPAPALTGDSSNQLSLLQRMASWVAGGSAGSSSQPVMPHGRPIEDPQASQRTSPCGYRVGDAVDYRSSNGPWLRCSILAVSQAGDVELDIRPGKWLNSKQQTERLRKSAKSISAPVAGLLIGESGAARAQQDHQRRQQMYQLSQPQPQPQPQQQQRQWEAKTPSQRQQQQQQLHHDWWRQWQAWWQQHQQPAHQPPPAQQRYGLTPALHKLHNFPHQLFHNSNAPATAVA